jgi:hypothetical protein
MAGGSRSSFRGLVPSAWITPALRNRRTGRGRRTATLAPRRRHLPIRQEEPYGGEGQSSLAAAFDNSLRSTWTHIARGHCLAPWTTSPVAVGATHNARAQCDVLLPRLVAPWESPITGHRQLELDELWSAPRKSTGTQPLIAPSLLASGLEPLAPTGVARLDISGRCIAPSQIVSTC